MRLIKFIKIFLISLYIVFLGFVLFFNSSSVYAEEQYQTGIWETSNGFDLFFINCQDQFDYTAFGHLDLSGYNYYRSIINGYSIYYSIYTEKLNSYTYNGVTYGEGFKIILYSPNSLSTSTTFVDATFTNYWGSDLSMTVKAARLPSQQVAYIYNTGSAYVPVHYEAVGFNIPMCLINYPHPVAMQYRIDTISNTSSAQIVSSINTQTNTIANETKKQTNAITTATKEQTNALLDTNDTGNETMSVNDTTTDTSADLGGLFNQISSSFTDTTSETEKRF